MNNGFKVDFIGIGAQKGATSWISKCLSEHPEVCFFSGKETHFFSKNYSSDIKKYEKLFSDCDDKKLTGEFSTSYLSDENAYKRIHDHFPEAKMLLCLRHPVDRAISHFFHMTSKGKYRGLGLSEMIQKEPSIIENGLYGKHLTKFLSIFPREQIKVVYYDDVKKNPRAVMKDIYNFLVIEDSFLAPSLDMMVNTRSERKSKLYKKINRLYFFCKEYSLGKKFINFLSKLGINYKLVNKIVNRKSQSVDRELGKQDKEWLRSFFADDIKSLNSILKKEVFN